MKAVLVRLRRSWLAVVLLLAACAPPPAPPPIVLLGDVSGSARSPEVQEAYRAAFTEALAHAAEIHATLTVETIEANPLQHSATPLAVDFNLPESVRSNPVYAQPLLARRREAALDAMDRLLDRPSREPGTDVFSALALAARVFDHADANGYLIVCSDMLQSTEEYDFYSRPLDEADAEGLIDQLRQQGELPDLAGVQVWVVGAGQDAGTEIDPERNRAIERFFRRYFATSGARLVSYAATLAAFPPADEPA